MIKRLFLFGWANVATTAAFAHPSTIPHEHPHGPSALPGLDAALLAILFAAFAFTLWRKFTRG